jgi:hypothetical protein
MIHAIITYTHTYPIDASTYTTKLTTEATETIDVEEILDTIPNLYDTIEYIGNTYMITDISVECGYDEMMKAHITANFKEKSKKITEEEKLEVLENEIQEISTEELDEYAIF